MSKEKARQAFEELCREAGFDEEKTKLALSFADNDKFAEKFSAGFVRHPEYSSALDKARNLEEKVNKWEDWTKTGWTAIKSALEKEGYVEVNGAYIKQSRSNDTDLNGGFEMDERKIQELINKGVQDQLQAFRGAVSTTMKDGLRVASRHAAQFKEELDVDALEKLALEKGLTIQQAYAELVGPRVREAEQKAEKERIERGIQEGVKDALSKMNLPFDPSSASSSPPAIFNFAKGSGDKVTSADKDANLLKIQAEVLDGKVA